MEPNVVTGGIFEYCQKLGISFSDVLKRKSRDRKAVLIEGMYMVMLERNGFDSDQIASLTNIEKKRVNQKLEAIRDAIVKKEPLAIKLYEIVKQITVKNGALNY